MIRAVTLLLSQEMKNFQPRWKNLIFLGFTKNSRVLGGFIKNQYIGRGDCLNRGNWTVCRFKRGLVRKRGVFLRFEVDTIMHTKVFLRSNDRNFWTFTSIYHNLQRIYISLPQICIKIFNLGIQITCTQNWSIDVQIAVELVPVRAKKISQ